MSELNDNMTNEEIRKWAMGIDDYAEVLKADGRDHKLYVHNNVIRWRPDPVIEMLYMELEVIDLNDMILKLARKYGDDYKNDYRLRRFYRGLGYSLSGYWEIFFWDVNNEAADKWVSDEYDLVLREKLVN